VEVEIKVDDTKGFMSSFWDIVKKKKPAYEKRIQSILERAAKTEHRYKSRTGNLRNATKAEIDLNKKIRLYVDEGKADYAKFVVNPRGTWKGDPFIDKAAENNNDEIMQVLKELYDESINEWNGKG